MYKDKEKQREANKAAAQRRRDKVKGCDDISPKGMTQEEGTRLLNPVDIYSPERWARLEAKGYVFKDGRGVRPDGNIAVTVPGDPGYGEVKLGVCKCCGKPTQHIKVVKCLACCQAGAVNPSDNTKSETFEDLPADVQQEIEKNCSESNNGARADTHSRHAMTERALDYQGKKGKRAEPYQEPVIDPLTVYHPDRWARLQAKGYEFTTGPLATRHSPMGTLTAPPLPGDPAYHTTVPVGAIG